MARIIPRPTDAVRLVRSPRAQAKGDPVPTIVLLVAAILAIQAAKAVRSGKPVSFDQSMFIKDGALVAGFVLAATFIPSDLIVAILLVVLAYDVVVDPTLIDDVVGNLVSRVGTR